MTPTRVLLIEALAAPGATADWSVAEWETLIRQARSSDTLGRLAARLQAAAGLDAVPSEARAHLLSALRLVEAQQTEIRRELHHLRQALATLDAPVVLLKGAAYVAAGLPAAQGRLASDIDILVPESRLTDAESLLMQHGWQTTHDDPYDQAYYRRWMHELPPMRHVRRDTMLDVHHAVLPRTGRRRIDSRRLLERCVPVDGQPGLLRLGDPDLVIHSACHLLQNEVFDRGFRDLSDLDLLLRAMSAAADFWPALAERAAALGVAEPVGAVLDTARRQLGTPVPVDLLPPPGPALRWACDRALIPLHPSARRPGTRLALAAMFLRAHWQRMPPLLLARHAFAKVRRALRAPAPAV